jgi:anti-sigma regulatory factor (Ser/Thr protein kinase)
MILSADVSMLGELRRSLTSWLEAHGVSRDVRDAVVLATHEAAVNAIEHARADATMITAAIDSDFVDVIVTNSGGPWTTQRHLDEERGRGISLIKGLMSEAVIHNDGHKTTAVMRLEL